MRFAYTSDFEVACFERSCVTLIWDTVTLPSSYYLENPWYRSSAFRRAHSYIDTEQNDHNHEKENDFSVSIHFERRSCQGSRRVPEPRRHLFLIETCFVGPVLDQPLAVCRSNHLLLLRGFVPFQPSGHLPCVAHSKMLHKTGPTRKPHLESCNYLARAMRATGTQNMSLGIVPV